MSVPIVIDPIHLDANGNLKVSLGDALPLALQEASIVRLSTPVQNVSVSHLASTQSAPFHVNTRAVTLTPFGVNCWVKIGQNPIATIGGAGCIPLMWSQSTQPIAITAGDKIAVISDKDYGGVAQFLTVMEIL